jgi:hypothetical protein
LFIDAFGKSNIGALTALKGADFLQSLNLPSQITIIGIIILDLSCQSSGWFGFCQMGIDQSDFRPNVDAVGYFTRFDPSGIQGRGFRFQYHYPFATLFSTDSCILPTVCEVDWHRNFGFYDASLFHCAARDLDNVFVALLDFGDSIGIAEYL